MLQSARLLTLCAFAAAASVVGTAVTRAAWTDVSASAVTSSMPERGQHALECTIDGTLYVFGGARRIVTDRTRRFEFLGDFWRLAPGPGGVFEDLTAATHCPIPPTIEPHLASDAEGRIYEFGGIQESLTGWFSHRLYRFDPEDGAWSDLTPDDSLAAPPGREDHGFAGDWKRDVLWVFGGVTQSDDLLNDLWRYDVRANVWERIEPAGSSPVPRARELYDLVWDGSDGLYVFGGWDPAIGYMNDFWRYDIERRTWTDLTEVSGAGAITPRSYVGMCADANGIVWLAGGYAAPRAVGGFWRYDPLDGLWRDVTDRAPEEFLPRATYDLVCSPAEDAIYSFGGLITPEESADLLYANDLWRFPLRPEIQATALPPATVDASTQTLHAAITAASVSGRPLAYRWTLDGAQLASVADEVDAGPLSAGAHALHVDVEDGAIVQPLAWTLSVPGAETTTLRVTPSVLRATAPPASVSVCVPDARRVRIDLIGPHGRCLRTLHDGLVAAGGVSVSLDAGDLPAGVYLVRARAGEDERTARILLAR